MHGQRNIKLHVCPVQFLLTLGRSAVAFSVYGTRPTQKWLCHVHGSCTVQ